MWQHARLTIKVEERKSVRQRHTKHCKDVLSSFARKVVFHRIEAIPVAFVGVSLGVRRAFWIAQLNIALDRIQIIAGIGGLSIS